MSLPKQPYVTIPENIHSNERLRSMSKSAQLAWFYLTTWSKQNLRDGYFSPLAMKAIDVTQDDVDELVRAGGVTVGEDERGSYFLVGYNQRTRAEVETDIARRRENARLGGKASAEKRRSPLASLK